MPAETPAHIAARFEAIAADAATKTGPIQMLNMIRYRDDAVYQDGEAPAGPNPTGEEAYRTYGELAGPFVAEVGGARVWAARTTTAVATPPDEHWDAVFSVSYPDRAAFMALVGNPGYRAIVHHRTAAVADSRLIMLEM